MTRICLFDDVTGGHHTSYVSGLVGAAFERGDYVLVASPEPVVNLREGAASRWLPVKATQHRQVITARRVLSSVTRACRDDDIDVFLDLYLDKSIWTWPVEGVRSASSVHVLHHAHHYVYGRGGLSDPMKSLARKRLASFVQRGDMVAVHTSTARDILSAFLPASHIIRVGYPVHVPEGPVATEIPTASPRRQLLFVGQARAEKGAEVLVSALEWLPDDIQLAFVGLQDQRQRALLESRPAGHRVTWIDRFVSDTDLAGELRNADLVVLPYLSGFGLHGGASGVLLTTLAHGRPVVTTSTLEPQLPPEHKGAVVVEPGNAHALADGILSGFAGLEELRHQAELEGPTFVREQHSFDGYLRGLLNSVEG